MTKLRRDDGKRHASYREPAATTVAQPVKADGRIDRGGFGAPLNG
jgi:hypothetical protein